MTSIRTIWYSSDLHLNHANIIKYCKRPFASVSEMNEAIIERHNSVVKEHDIWYCGGDVYMGDAQNIAWLLSRLNGRRRLILGNHDNAKDQNLQRYFEKILLWRMFPEYKMLITHIPVHPSTLNPEKCPYNIHGHIHDKASPAPEYFNGSVEMINYTPISLEDIAVKIREQMKAKK